MRMLETALLYAAKGWAVFPVHTILNGHCSCGDRSCTSAAKHPAVKRGVKEATTNQGQIRAWWQQTDWNIGVATGRASKLLVIDLDVSADKNGIQSLACLEERFSPLDKSLSVTTGGGGQHIYFAMPDQKIRNSAGKIGTGIDVRSDGGYVVAPPSIHHSGNIYSWNK
ncbi:bifunctional DNA primase/polymerase [Octadecabacter sp. R77987]|uniref:bifunctional DNA primase/polymerase n=1 Tax=Octadecabacter sp. R77987 TaxID=3093874 RepID=UPI00366A9502